MNFISVNFCFSGQAIKSKLEIDCVADSSISELMRCIRGQLTNLMPNVDDQDLRVMSLGLGHSLSRYKLKFSPEKIDTMIVQVSTLFLTSVKYQAYPQSDTTQISLKFEKQFCSASCFDIRNFQVTVQYISGAN